MDLQTQVMIITAVCAIASVVVGIVGVRLYGNEK